MRKFIYQIFNEYDENLSFYENKFLNIKKHNENNQFLINKINCFNYHGNINPNFINKLLLHKNFLLLDNNNLYYLSKNLIEYNNIDLINKFVISIVNNKHISMEFFNNIFDMILSKKQLNDETYLYILEKIKNNNNSYNTKYIILTTNKNNKPLLIQLLKNENIENYLKKEFLIDTPNLILEYINIFEEKLELIYSLLRRRDLKFERLDKDKILDFMLPENYKNNEKTLNNLTHCLKNFLKIDTEHLTKENENLNHIIEFLFKNIEKDLIVYLLEQSPFLQEKYQNYLNKLQKELLLTEIKENENLKETKKRKI